jgi:hypothetical protein
LRDRPAGDRDQVEGVGHAARAGEVATGLGGAALGGGALTCGVVSAGGRAGA